MKGTQKTRMVMKATMLKGKVSPLLTFFKLILTFNSEHVNVIPAEQDDEPDMSDEEEYGYCLWTV